MLCATTAEGANREPPLAGLTVLVVEDESIIAFLIEDMLTELGCAAVWHAGSIKEALALLEEHRPDAAVLDVNLAGEPSHPIAERLAAAHVPLVFATGYGVKGVPEGWEDRPVIQKPFTLEMLGAGLSDAIAHA